MQSLDIIQYVYIIYIIICITRNIIITYFSQYALKYKLFWKRLILHIIITTEFK